MVWLAVFNCGFDGSRCHLLPALRQRNRQYTLYRLWRVHSDRGVCFGEKPPKSKRSGRAVEKRGERFLTNFQERI